MAASHFPSLEELEASDAQPTQHTATVADGDDDMGDFLQREQAHMEVLGDVGANFGETPQEANNGDDDLLGEGAQEFADAYPSVESQNQNERVAPGGTITGSGSPFPPTGYQNTEPEDEGDAVREWRDKRDSEITRRAEISNEKKEATVKKAREDIDDFYVSYNNKADKHRAQTKAEAEQFMASREDTSAGGTSWERIAKLVDVSGKGNTGGASGSGKERFRELLIDLRKDQEAPGASGI